MTVASKTSFFSRDKKMRRGGGGGTTTTTTTTQMKDLSYISEDTEVVIDDNTTDADFNNGTANGSLDLSQLHMFAISGNRKKLQEAINSGAHDINETDNMGRTPLIYSVLVEQMDCVVLLLKSGADPDKPDGDGRTALHWAAYQGNHKLVKLIISKCKKTTVYDKEGRTPLHLAISHDNIKVLEIILKFLEHDEVDATDNKSMTALCWAVFYERIEHTRLLLSHSASTIILDSEGRSVLHWTSQNKSPVLINLLLEEGCPTINFEDKEGRTPLHMAVGHGGFNMVQYLLSLPDIMIDQQDAIKRTPLHWAAVLGQKQIVEMLLKKGADYSLADCNGARALHYAAQNNNYDVVISMLNLHQVTDEPDNEKRTALMWASLKGSVEVMKVLLERKCTDLNAVDIHQQTALHMSCVAGHLECVKLLIASGANVNIVDKKHYIPLFYACASGHVEIVTELLGQNSMSNLDSRDLEGRTALHFSAMVDRRKIIEILIQHKLDPNMRDNAGCQPLHIAAYGGFVHCMSVLLENGAKVNMQDSDGRTALHMACRSGALDAVKLLVSRYQASVNVLDNSDEGLTALDYAFLEDHQDVVFFLVENSAVTASVLKDSSATKIQAIFRGYQFRKDFADQRVFMVKHERTRKRDFTPTNLSSGSDTTSVKLNPLWRVEPNGDNHDNNSMLPSPSSNYSSLQQQQQQQQQHTNNTSSLLTTTHGPPTIPRPHSYIEVRRRQSMKSQTSAMSSVSLVSSRSSAHLNPDRVPRFSDARQGPKFYDGSANPFSLNRVSRALSPYANSKLFVNPPPKAKSTTGVFTHGKGEKPYKRSSVGQQDTNSKFRKHSTKSNAGVAEYFTSQQVDSARVNDRNSHYNTSYSRYNSSVSDKRAMSDSSGSTLFKTRSSHYPLPQISLPKSPKSDDTSSTQSLPEKSAFKPSVPSAPVFKPSPPSTQPPSQRLSSNNIYSTNIHHSEGDNKPWNIFRRDQKRINIIRQKTEAAIKIQSAFRAYRAQKNPSKNPRIQVYNYIHNYNNPETTRSTPDFTLSSGRLTATSDFSMTDVESCVLNPDSETDSYDTGFSIDDLDEIPDEETLHEVAALVIQATWRQYVKDKLMLEVKRSQENLNDDTLQKAHANDYIEPAIPETIPDDTMNQQDRLHNNNNSSSSNRDRKHKKTKKHKEGKVKHPSSSVSTAATLDHDQSMDTSTAPTTTTYENLKKKLAPSQSFPLMQNIYRESMRKKRSKRFSIKKRLLARSTTTTSASTNNSSLHLNETSLMSISPNLSRAEIEAVKSGKPKVLLSKMKKVDFH